MQKGERQEFPNVKEAVRQSDEQELMISHLEKLLLEREEAVQHLQGQLSSIKGSAGWAMFQKLWNIYERWWLRPITSKGASRLFTRSDGTARSNGDQSQDNVTKEVSQANGVSHGVIVTAENMDLTKAFLNRSRLALKDLGVNDIRTIAFYLPQFHPIPENDLWWGQGFTEWTNVTKARPNFEGHYQPHLPSDLGFYDLRIPEVRERQAELALEYGIHGFCYYHYWFGGRRLLERPFNEVLSSGRPDFPFCLCWANENWTRRWDGAEKEILMAQQYSDEDDRNFIRSLFPAFEDSRYIRIDGKPLLLVYRADILKNAKQTAAVWREEMKNAGLGDIYLCAAQSFVNLDPRPFEFDSAVEFPPHGTSITNLKAEIPMLNPSFEGFVIDYVVKASAMIHRPKPDYTLFKTVMPGWDNTPRRQNNSFTYINSSPEAYEYWLGKAVEYTINHHKGDKRLVFINAWNEWGEGAHLEPDRRYGRRYLEATRNVLSIVRGK